LLPAAVVPLVLARAAAPCAYEHAGHHFDLRGAVPSELSATSESGFRYFLSVCGPTQTVCNGAPSVGSKWRGTKCNNLGDEATRSLSLLDARDPRKGINITYRKGDVCLRGKDETVDIGSRSLTLSLVCDPSVSVAKLRGVAEPSMCETVATVVTHRACPSTSSSWAGRLVVLLLLAGGATAAYRHGFFRPGGPAAQQLGRWRDGAVRALSSVNEGASSRPI